MKRLTNKKTKSETGFEQVIYDITAISPYGKQKMKNIHPFFPGEEKELRDELLKVERMFNIIQNDIGFKDRLEQIFMEIKDITFTLQRSQTNVLSIVELYEVKGFLILSEKLDNELSQVKENIDPRLMLNSTTPILNILDPGKDRINTFYIYDEFSSDLSKHRKRKRELELSLRKEQKRRWEEIEEKHNIKVSSRNEIIVSKADLKHRELVSHIDELVIDEEDYMTITYKLKTNDTVLQIKNEIEKANNAIEEEEYHVQEILSRNVAEYADIMLNNTEKVAELDFILAKTVYAKKNNCVQPTIIEDHVIEIIEGRHLVVEKFLHGKGKNFCPISIFLKNGVTCITGANMGGKTVSLKLVGLITLMAQYGLYVPCQSASLGLSSYVQILIGDSQSLQRGLSSFGGEMEELKEILDNSTENALVLIDEIASGTNPVEGLALAKSLVSYLNRQSFITLITTHFDHFIAEGGIKNIQVRGLADADIEKMVRELRYANRRERIEIISKHMDYRLCQIESDSDIPRDALNIAKMFGISDEIIDNAKQFVEESVAKGGKKYERETKSQSGIN